MCESSFGVRTTRGIASSGTCSSCEARSPAAGVSDRVRRVVVLDVEAPGNACLLQPVEDRRRVRIAATRQLVGDGLPGVALIANMWFQTLPPRADEKKRSKSTYWPARFQANGRSRCVVVADRVRQPAQSAPDAVGGDEAVHAAGRVTAREGRRVGAQPEHRAARRRAWAARSPAPRRAKLLGRQVAAGMPSAPG